MHRGTECAILHYKFPTFALRFKVCDFFATLRGHANVLKATTHY